MFWYKNFQAVVTNHLNPDIPVLLEERNPNWGHHIISINLYAKKFIKVVDV